MGGPPALCPALGAAVILFFYFVAVHLVLRVVGTDWLWGERARTRQLTLWFLVLFNLVIPPPLKTRARQQPVETAALVKSLGA